MLAGCRKRQSNTRAKQTRRRRTENVLVEVPRSNSACQSHCRPYRLESRMRENRLSGSEGGATLIPSSLPLSIISSLRDKNERCPVEPSHQSPMTNHPSPLPRRAPPLARRGPFPFTKGAEEGIRVFVPEQASDLREPKRGLQQIRARQFTPGITDQAAEGGSFRGDSAL